MTGQIAGSRVPVTASVKVDTEYVVLRWNGNDAEKKLETWAVVGTFTARTAGDAAKAAHARRGSDNGSTYVAVPARSWKPVRVTPKVETSLVVEEVRDDG